MTEAEANVWWLYAEKYGLDPINPRSEIVLANIAHLICVGAGIKDPATGKPLGADTFVKWMKSKEPESDVPATKDEIMSMFPIRKK